MEEAAVSHMMHRADNIPKIKFQLVCENENQFSVEPSLDGTNQEFMVARQSIPYYQRNNTGKGPGSYSSAALRSRMPEDDNLISPIGKLLLSDNQDIETGGDKGVEFSADYEPIKLQIATQDIAMAQIGYSPNSRQAPAIKNRSHQAASLQGRGIQVISGPRTTTHAQGLESIRVKITD